MKQITKTFWIIIIAIIWAIILELPDKESEYYAMGEESQNAI